MKGIESIKNIPGIERSYNNDGQLGFASYGFGVINSNEPVVVNSNTVVGKGFMTERDKELFEEMSKDMYEKGVNGAGYISTNSVSSQRPLKLGKFVDIETELVRSEEGLEEDDYTTSPGGVLHKYGMHVVDSDELFSNADEDALKSWLVG